MSEVLNPPHEASLAMLGQCATGRKKSKEQKAAIAQFQEKAEEVTFNNLEVFC